MIARRTFGSAKSTNPVTALCPRCRHVQVNTTAEARKMLQRAVGPNRPNWRVKACQLLDVHHPPRLRELLPQDNQGHISPTRSLPNVRARSQSLGMRHSRQQSCKPMRCFWNHLPTINRDQRATGANIRDALLPLLLRRDEPAKCTPRQREPVLARTQTNKLPLCHPVAVRCSLTLTTNHSPSSTRAANRLERRRQLSAQAANEATV